MQFFFAGWNLMLSPTVWLSRVCQQHIKTVRAASIPSQKYLHLLLFILLSANILYTIGYCNETKKYDLFICQRRAFRSSHHAAAMPSDLGSEAPTNVPSSDLHIICPLPKEYLSGMTVISWPLSFSSAITALSIYLST